MAQVDWRQIVFDSRQGVLKKLEKLASDRFKFDAALAEEAFNAVLTVLSRDDWARLARFDGRGSAPSYLVKVFSNALEDFARQRFGRPRPPVVIQRRGGVWLEIHQRLIVERQLEPSVIDVLVARTDWPVADIQAAIREVKALCRSPANPVRFVPLQDEADPEAGGEPVVDPHAEPASRLRRSWYEQVLYGLSRLLGRADTAAGGRGEADDAPFGGLDDEDCVLLRLLYAEGLSLAAGARLLGRPEHEVRRRHQRLLQTLRQQLPPAEALTPED